jgi:hypothetical protein
VKGRDYVQDREQAERRKLKKLLKREAKGPARELFLIQGQRKRRVTAGG